MLDQFGGIGVSSQKDWGLSLRAIRVQGTGELLLNDWLIDSREASPSRAASQPQSRFGQGAENLRPRFLPGEILGSMRRRSSIRLCCAPTSAFAIGHRSGLALCSFRSRIGSHRPRFAMARATASIAERSASPLGNGGVPTQMKIASPQEIASSVDPKCSRPALRPALMTSSICGSKIGITPFCNFASFSRSLSLQNTSWPICARQAAVVSPTSLRQSLRSSFSGCP